MKRKISTFICFGIMLVVGMIFVIIGPLLAEISKTFSLTLSQSGLIFAANFIGFSVFVILGGITADHWGKKKVLSIAMAGIALSLLILPLSPSFFIICLITVFTGGFLGILESMTTALVADLNPSNASFYINLTQVFFGIGAFVGPMMAGLMVSSGFSWKQCYFVLGGLMAVMTILFVADRIPSLPNPDKIEWVGFKNLVTDWKFILICLCVLFYTGSEVGGWGWMSTFLEENMGFPIEKSSLAVSVFWLALIAGRVLCTSLTLKFSVRFLTIVLAFSSVAATVLSALVRSELAIWLAITAMGLAYSSLFPLIIAYGSSQYRKYTGTVFALLMGSGGVGMALIPFLLGLAGQYIGIRVAMMSPAVLFLLIGIILLNINNVRPKMENS